MSRPLRTLSLALTLIAALPLGAAACGHDEAAETQATEAARYETTGTITRVEAERGSVTIAHEDVPGYMPGMTMPFTVEDPALFEGLAEGDRVAFTFEARSGGAHVIVAITER